MYNIPIRYDIQRVLQHAKYLARLIAVRPSDYVLLLLYIHGWRYVLLLLYRTIARPGERPVLRAIMPSGPNSFGRNPPHTRPAGRLKRAADHLPRDCDDAAPRAIIASDSRAYVIIIIIIIVDG